MHALIPKKRIEPGSDKPMAIGNEIDSAVGDELETV